MKDSADQSAATGCILLVPAAFDAPTDLLDGLRRRGARLREVRDEPAAMLALADADFSTLIVIEPQAVLELNPLLGAVRRYHPHVRLWQYRWQGRPRLSAIEDARREAESFEVAKENSSEQTPTDRVRPAAPVPPEAPQARPTADTESVTLTEEELSMLLGGASAETSS